MGAAEGEFTFAAWDRNSGFNDYVYAYATEAVEQAARDRRAPNYAWEAAAGASDQASAAAAALAVNTSAWSTGKAAERIAQASLLRDIFGPIPLKPVTIHPEVLAWSDGTVRKIAQGIYEERAFDRLPILAGRAARRWLRRRGHPGPLPRRGASRPRLLGHRPDPRQGMTLRILCEQG